MFRLSSDEGDYLKCQVGISSRAVRRVFTFVAQQRLLPCATNDAALRKAVGGAGVVSSKERSAIYTFLHFYTAKNKHDSPPIYTFLHVLHG